MLYIISAILGLSAVVLTTNGEVKAMMLLLALCAAGALAARLFLNNQNHQTQSNQPAIPTDNNPFFGEEDHSNK